MDARSIAERLRARREYLKRQMVYGYSWTQDYVAERIGMSEGNYSRIEKGRVDIPAHELPRYADVLLVPLSYFFEENFNPAQPPVSEPGIFVVREQGAIGIDAHGRRSDVPETMQQQLAELLRAVNNIQEELNRMKKNEDRE